MTESSPDFDDVLKTRERRGEIETRRDVWLTAAVMTMLFPPVGTLFGLIALLVARGGRAALDSGDLQRASDKLDMCRVLVAIGTAYGIAVVLYQVSQLATGMAAVALLLQHSTDSR